MLRASGIVTVMGIAFAFAMAYLVSTPQVLKGANSMLIVGGNTGCSTGQQNTDNQGNCGVAQPLQSGDITNPCADMGADQCFPGNPANNGSCMTENGNNGCNGTYTGSGGGQYTCNGVPDYCVIPMPHN